MGCDIVENTRMLKGPRLPIAPFSHEPFFAVCLFAFLFLFLFFISSRLFSNDLTGDTHLYKTREEEGDERKKSYRLTCIFLVFSSEI